MIHHKQPFEKMEFAAYDGCVDTWGVVQHGKTESLFLRAGRDGTRPCSLLPAKVCSGPAPPAPGAWHLTKSKHKQQLPPASGGIDRLDRFVASF